MASPQPVNLDNQETPAIAAASSTATVQANLSAEVQSLIALDLANVTAMFNAQVNCLVFNGYPQTYAVQMTVIQNLVPHLQQVLTAPDGSKYVGPGGPQYIPAGYVGPLPAA